MREKYYQGETSIRATQKYKDKIGMQVVRINLQAGSKEALEEEAAKSGVSVTQYIVDAVNAYAQRELIQNKRK